MTDQSISTNHPINVYDDGKLSRVIKADLVQEKDGQYEIMFFDEFSGEMITDWFVEDHEGSFWHEPTNAWFFPERETEAFKEECRE